METERKKLTEEEINSLKQLNQQYREFTAMLGNISLQEINLKKRKESVEKDILELMIEEQGLAQSLQSKYGEGEIVLETGEILVRK
jgi:predicted nucleotidyltransferase